MKSKLHPIIITVVQCAHTYTEDKKRKPTTTNKNKKKTF